MSLEELLYHELRRLIASLPEKVAHRFAGEIADAVAGYVTNEVEDELLAKRLELRERSRQITVRAKGAKGEAQTESQVILAAAQLEASQIVTRARREGRRMVEDAHAEADVISQGHRGICPVCWRPIGVMDGLLAPHYTTVGDLCPASDTAIRPVDSDGKEVA